MRVRYLVEAQAFHFIALLCFDFQMPRFELSAALRDVFYIINYTMCPPIIVVTSRVGRATALRSLLTTKYSNVSTPHQQAKALLMCLLRISKPRRC